MSCDPNEPRAMKARGNSADPRDYNNATGDAGRVFPRLASDRLQAERSGNRADHDAHDRETLEAECVKPHNVGPITGRAGTEPRSTDGNHTAGPVRCIGGLSCPRSAAARPKSKAPD